MIEVRGVTKYIKDSLILDDINLKLEKNHIYGFKGANGSGKTMLFRAIAGLMPPTKGKIIINDEILYKDISFPRSVGVLIENPAFLPGLTGKENLDIIAGMNIKDTKAVVDEALTKVGLLPDDKRKYRKYSLGMKQRLGIAAAIMSEPDLVILDEPFNALDPDGISLIRNLLIELKKKSTILVACHDREELELVADYIYMVRNGRIEGETNEVS